MSIDRNWPHTGRGRFITFEGADGSGKTTQIKLLADALGARGVDVVTTREPGGSPGADAIRRIILSGAAEALGSETEAILFAAARRDHIRTVIEPALSSGAFVLSDRYMDSTRAYQGLVSTLDETFLQAIEDATIANVRPNLTIILDLPAAVRHRRLVERRGTETPDRFEKDTTAIQEARRQAFLSIAAREPGRCVVIDADAPAADISAQIAELVFVRFKNDLVHRSAASGGV